MKAIIIILVLLLHLGAATKAQSQSPRFTYVTIPTTNNIQTTLMNTFPTGVFTANNALQTPFSIPDAPGKCGASGASPCNYYDGFGTSGSGKSITMDVSVASPTDVYTLINAYDPAAGQQLATITFVGTGNASLTFPLIGGEDIRDYHQGVFANTLTNGLPGVQALNAFSCVVPTTCQDKGGLGPAATYVFDEQHFSLGATFAGQTVTQIMLTDTYNGSSPILLGVTVGSGSTESVQSIPVQNPSFEAATLPENVGDGPFCNLIAGSTLFPTGGALANWTAASTTLDAWAGVIAPHLGGGDWTYTWWAGNNVGATAMVGPGTVSLSQTLSATLQNNVTYTLSVVVARPITTGMFNYAIQLWAGSTMLASASNLEGLPSDSSGTDSASYSSGTNSPLAGQPLKIVLSSTGIGALTGAFFDEVALYASSGSTELPAILQTGGLLNGASFQAGIVPGSWLTIFGTNLSSKTDNWVSAISNGKLPTSLDDVRVRVGGEPANISYVSPKQIDAVVPNVGTGPVEVTVTNSSGTSSAVTATAQAVQPAFFEWPGSYAVATTLEYSLAVKNGTFPGATTTPAKPGEVIVLWGTGFGPTSPPAPEGIEAPSSTTYYTANTVTVTVGDKAATVYSAVLAPGFAGLYQVAIQIPASLANGDYPVVAKISGAQSPSTTLITVQE